jgi:sugar phosphate isomerase/epimerase
MKVGKLWMDSLDSTWCAIAMIDNLQQAGHSRRRMLETAAAAAGLVSLRTATATAAEETPPAKPAFGLGLVTYNVAMTWDLPTILKVCQNVGIGAVELRTTHAHGVEPTLDAAARREVRKRFEDSGVVCWGCGSTCEFHSPDQAIVKGQIETCKRFVQLVADIGGRGVKVRPNGLPKEVPAKTTLELIGKALSKCGEAAADAGVEIWMEVHGAETSKPDNVWTIMENCCHPSVGLTWNSNATDVEDGSIAKSFKMLRRWIKSCHINDLYKDARGEYPYRELFRSLGEREYDRYTLIEVGKSFPDPTLGEEFLRYYKALWSELCKV